MNYFGYEYHVSKFGGTNLFIIIITVFTASSENPAILKEDHVLDLEMNPKNLQGAIKYTSQQLCNPTSLSATLAPAGFLPCAAMQRNPLFKHWD